MNGKKEQYMKNERHVSKYENTWHKKNMFMTKIEIMWHVNETHGEQKACDENIGQSCVFGPKCFSLFVGLCVETQLCVAIVKHIHRPNYVETHL